MYICGDHIDIGETYVYNCTYVYIYICVDTDTHIFKHLARYAAISSLNFRWNQSE